MALQRHIRAIRRHGKMSALRHAATPIFMPVQGPAMTDDEFAALASNEREFAIRWVQMSEEQQDRFCRGLLAAIEVLQRLGVLDDPASPGEVAPA
jgi:hypothetical protein